MKHHGLIFSDSSVLKIRDGTKTQTRRTKGLKMARPESALVKFLHGVARFEVGFDRDVLEVVCPYTPGDLLWGREAWREDVAGEDADGQGGRRVVCFRAGNDCADELKWGSPLYLEKVDARLWMRLLDVRPQRVQDISAADAIAEGTSCWGCGGRVDGRSENECYCFHSKSAAIPSFQVAWDELNGKRAPWESNPWVWALTFENTARPILTDGRHAS